MVCLTMVRLRSVGALWEPCLMPGIKVCNHFPNASFVYTPERSGQGENMCQLHVGPFTKSSW
ncbi:hypothetical protein WJX77_002852 [Trebouxia sp. C0004]